MAVVAAVALQSGHVGSCSPRERGRGALLGGLQCLVLIRQQGESASVYRVLH